MAPSSNHLKPQWPVLRLLLVGVLLMASVACTPASNTQSDTTSKSVGASVTLHVVVVNDAALAAAINRLRGEWNELDGTEFTVENTTVAELLTESTSDQAADLLIFAERHLGELCQTGRLRPLRESVLEEEELSWQDFLPLVRQQIVRYDSQIMALPIGCPVPLAAADASITGTPTIQEMVRPSYELLARGAGYAQHPSTESVLFNPESMNPRIASPPFKRALAEMLVGRSKAKQKQTVLLLPLRSQALESSTPEASSWQVTPVPAVAECYNPLADQWEKPAGGSQSVPLLGTRGRLLGVSRSTKNAATAFRLAGWLANRQNASQLAIASDSVANIRTSRSKAADAWREGLGRDFARQVADAQTTSLSARHALMVPRIHQIDRYLDAVDEILEPALKEAAEKDSFQAASELAEELLKEVERRWNALTEKIGVDRQREAYRAHLATDE